MPSAEDKERRYADLAIECNNTSIGNALPLANSTTLGKEWGYYKRNIDKQKREEKEGKDGGERHENRSRGFGDRRNDDRDGGFRR